MLIKNQQEEIQDFLSDESKYPGYCDAVYFPESEAEVIDVIKKCNSEKLKVTIAGNGTGLTSGRVPEGGIVLSTAKLNKIVELNEKEKSIVVQPGVLLNDLQDFVESKSLFYPPDPTERNCFIGATVVTNSSGARTFKYGPTRNYVLSLRIVLPDGEVLSINRGIKAKSFNASLITESGKVIDFKLPNYEMPSTKNAAGYFCKENMDLIDLFIGSEGTLGIITEIKLKLINLPKELLSCVVFFNTEEGALEFVNESRSLSRSNTDVKIIDPRALEFFDKYTCQFLREDYPNIPQKAEAAVWFEQELNNNEDELLTAWMELISKHGGYEEESWFAVDKSEQEKFKVFRHAIPLKVNELVSGRGLKKIGTDVAVPDEKFKQYYYETINLLVENKINYVVYGHVGNSHIHLNMLPLDQKEFVKAKELYAEICRNAIKLKGTFSAEHGVGKLKRDYLLKMYGEETVKDMALLKSLFDPNKILNIGNIFDEKYLQ